MQRWFPLLAEVDPLTHSDPWFEELRATYADLLSRRQRVAGIYDAFATDLSHYCDGTTVRQRFRPKDLAPAKAFPDFKSLFDGTSGIKPPSQRQLVSIVHHEAWVELAEECVHFDGAEGTADRRKRESTRLIDVSQPLAGAWIRMKPSCPDKRVSSADFRYELQRRIGLHVTGAPAEVAAMLRRDGVPVDYLGDYFSITKGDRRPPHDDALRVWHDLAQASATSAVVMGDKSKPEDYRWANNGHVLDLGEPRRGKGGTDRIMELKVYNSLVPSDATPDTSCSLRGDTHAFGNTEEYLIRQNKGVKARQGERSWSNADGAGHVALHKGCYDDAIYVKRNEMWLVIHNVFSGLNKEGVKLFNLYRARAKHGTDRTDYVANDKGAYDVHSFAPHWAQLLSAAIVKGDARRALHAVDRCRDDCLRSSARRVLADLRPQPLPATPRPAACARPLQCPARP